MVVRRVHWCGLPRLLADVHGWAGLRYDQVREEQHQIQNQQ